MFSEERDDLPQEPEADVPEGAPGEPGEATPSEAAPDPAEGEGPAGDEAPAEGEGPPEGEAPAEDEGPSEGEAVGPEIEGIEELAAQGQPSGEEAEAEAEAPRERRPRRERRGEEREEEVIPGMHLEPDLVLEEQPREESEYGEYGGAEEDFEPGEPAEAPAEEAPAEPEPVAHTPLDLAADARYRATGKRKSAVARVILKPGEGTYSVNGRHLDEYFPRVKLQRIAQQPLEAAGYHGRMDVLARIHGGGVSAQATALRHGVARALVEADPALRGELKRRGYLTRDPRVKERKKAGLKKARKRPQFSKR
jgi:small subunit ribosomal protein S9